VEGIIGEYNGGGHGSCGYVTGIAHCCGGKCKKGMNIWTDCDADGWTGWPDVRMKRMSFERYV
jgi:hypothetical protein